MEKPTYIGHRQRMKAKFFKNGEASFDTYELIEMLLYSVIPVKDTKPLAKALLSHFGTVDGVLSASEEELMAQSGIGPSAAKLIRAVGKMKSELSLVIPVREDKKNRISFLSYDECGEYLVRRFEGSTNYRVIMLSLNNKMELIGEDVLYDIDYASGGVKPQAFIENAVNRKAAVVIVAHNHPYSLAYPTEGDRQTNVLVCDALSEIGIVMAEHYIISGSAYLGFVNHLASAFSQKNFLETFVKSKEAKQ
jgi:DNA repair protein RadC